MKTDGLGVGNILMYRDKDDVLHRSKVLGVNNNVVLVLVEDGGFEWVICDDLSPIEISEKELVSLGFKDSTDLLTYRKKVLGAASEGDYPYAKYYKKAKIFSIINPVKSMNFTGPIEYVHELQEFLKLIIK